jgi:glutamate-1-semialdehyde 2,1-aminomutase
LKTLEGLSAPGTYDQLEKRCQKLEDGLVEALADAGVTGRVQRVGSMFTLFFNDGSPLWNFVDVQKCDHGKFKTYFHAMLERGIYLPPSGYEAAFVSLAHSSDDVERTIEAAKAAIAAARDG